MAGDKKIVTVKILDREYTLSCEPDEAYDLVDAAGYLDFQMRSITQRNQALGAGRCAIMAALNIANELLQLRNSLKSDHDFSERLEKLHDKIDRAMDDISPNLQ